MDRANDPRYNFGAGPSLDEIIAQQGKGPITDLSVLHGAPRTGGGAYRGFSRGTPWVARPQEDGYARDLRHFLRTPTSALH